MMNIASLFVTLGLKGNVEAVKGIQKIRNEINDTKGVTLGWRAAMVGVLGGLHMWMKSSTSQGMALKQFADYTGMSADQLQRWQYLFKLARVEGEEVTSSLQNMQSVMTKFAMGGDLPQGFDQIAAAVGGIDETKLQDSFYVLSKLREYAQKEQNVGLANVNLGSMGLSPQVIAALRSSTVDLDKIPKSLLLTKEQVNALAGVDQRWTQVFIKLNRQMDNFMAKHGNTMIKGVEAIANAIMKIGDALLYVAEQFKVFEALDAFFTKLGESVKFFTDNATGKRGDVKQFMENIPDALKLMFMGGNKTEQLQKDRASEIFKNNPAGQKILQEKGQKGAQNIQIKQELIFSGPQDAAAVAQYHRDGAEEAYRQTFGQVAFS